MEFVDTHRKDIKREIEESTCCFCLRQNNLLSLFDVLATGDKHENYAAMIADCFQIEMIVSNGDYFKYLYAICEFCISRLKIAFNFRTDVQNGLKRIKSIVASDASSSNQHDRSENYPISMVNIKSEINQKEEHRDSEDEIDPLNSSESVMNKESDDSDINTNTSTGDPADMEFNLPLQTEMRVSDEKLGIVRDTYAMIPNTVRRCTMKKNNTVSLQTLNRDADLSTMALSVCDQNTALEFFQICGIIPQQKLCQNGHQMNIVSNKKNTPLWVCKKRTCRTRNGVRNDTWLQHSRIPLETVVHFIYHWSTGTISDKFCVEQLGISNKPAYEWNNILKGICAWRVDRYDAQIGGEGLRVEIHGSPINHLENKFVFAGVCTETKDIFIVPISEVSVNTVTPIIAERIKPGSVIISCDSQMYSSVNMMKQYAFVKPDSVNDMKDIGNVFAFIHLNYSKQTGFSRNMLASNIPEWIWRLKLGERNAFEAILRDIVAFWEANHKRVI